VFPWATAPKYLIRDNNSAYGHVLADRVRAMTIRDRPICPGSPWQIGAAERLIGTLRCECLEHAVVFGERHLQRILSASASYYNQTRLHRSPCKDAPLRRAIQRTGNIAAIPILGGLYDQNASIYHSERTG